MRYLLTATSILFWVLISSIDGGIYGGYQTQVSNIVMFEDYSSIKSNTWVIYDAVSIDNKLALEKL